MPGVELVALVRSEHTERGADILADGSMAVSPALPEEGNDHALADLPRLVLHFNRRHFGRLRQFIDALNQLPALPSVR